MTVRNARGRYSRLILDIVDPSLPGAACVDLAPMFDGYRDGEAAEDREQRQREALQVCQTCPVREGCHDRRIELQRGPWSVEGVWAGEVLAPAPSGAPCRVCGDPVSRARHRSATCSKACSDTARTRRPRTGTCLVCDDPIPETRLRLGAITCTKQCGRRRELERETQIREAHTAAEVAWVLANGTPDVGPAAKARLVAHWTAAGRDQAWIATKLRLSVRQVGRYVAGEVSG